MKDDVQIGQGWPEVLEHFAATLIHLCREYAIFPGELLDSRHKRKPIADARGVFVLRLRDTVYQRIYVANNERWIEFCVVSNKANWQRGDWQPISYPCLQRFLGLANHTTAILAERRMRGNADTTTETMPTSGV